MASVAEIGYLIVRIFGRLNIGVLRFLFFIRFFVINGLFSHFLLFGH
jgi:hypothetical protein